MKHKRSDRLVHMRNLACVVEPNQFSIELFSSIFVRRKKVVLTYFRRILMLY